MDGWGGAEIIGFPPDRSGGIAAISADGSVLVGTLHPIWDPTYTVLLQGPEPIRWSKSGSAPGIMMNLGFVGHAGAVSANGAVVVGVKGILHRRPFDGHRG